jgi:subtilisin family serine protease
VGSKIKNEELKEILVNYNKNEDTETYLLKIDSVLTEQKLATIYKDSVEIVKNSEPNYAAELAAEPALKTINLDQLKLEAPESFMSAKISVAVIDSGIDETHVKLKKNIVDYANFASDSKTKEDLVGHGTHIAGVILSEAPSATIIPIKFTDGRLGKLSDLLRALDYAIAKDADIINLSLGIAENSRFLEEKINKALKNNIVIVAAAGNQNSDQKFYPAAQQDVISVAGLNKKGEKMFSSNYGDWIDFAVIGQDVYSTFPKNNYRYWSGTSQAAAKLTGIIIARSEENDIHKTIENLSKLGETTKIGRIIDEDLLMTLASVDKK